MRCVVLAAWIGFLATGALTPAWLAFFLLNVGNGFGDSIVVHIHRQAVGQRVSYPATIGAN